MDLNTKNTKFQSQVRPQLSVSLCAGEATSFSAQFDHHKKKHQECPMHSCPLSSDSPDSVVLGLGTLL